jgi:L-fuconolactonase
LIEVTHLAKRDITGRMDRRAFLLGTLASGVWAVAGERARSIPIIDTHIHLFDTGRSQGVPWPPKHDRVLYHKALPDRYRKIATPLGITGAIEVECSPWLDYNQWMLDVAAKDTIVVGTVGNLDLGTPDFRRHLERLHGNPLFLGIRHGNLWGRDLSVELGKRECVSDVKALADAGLVLDTAMQTPEMIAAAVRVTDQVPNLRVVMDHLPQFVPPTDARTRGAVDANLRELGKRPQVYVKISEVLRHVDDRVPTDLTFYQARLDEIFGIFGEDRVLFGSDWPNSDTWAPYPQVLSIVREYFTAQGAAAAEKYFWKNSIAAYRWVRRAKNQPQIGLA